MFICSLMQFCVSSFGHTKHCFALCSLFSYLSIAGSWIRCLVLRGRGTRQNEQKEHIFKNTDLCKADKQGHIEKRH